MKEEREVLEDVGRDPEAKVVEDLIRYELNEPSLDCLFLTSANLEERERTEPSSSLQLIRDLCMDTLRDAWDRFQLYQARAQRPPRCSTSEAMGNEILNRACGYNDRRSVETKGGKCNNRNSLPELIVKHSRGKEKDRQMKGLRRLHKPQPSLFEGLLSFAEY